MTAKYGHRTLPQTRRTQARSDALRELSRCFAGCPDLNRLGKNSHVPAAWDGGLKASTTADLDLPFCEDASV